MSATGLSVQLENSDIGIWRKKNCQSSLFKVRYSAQDLRCLSASQCRFSALHTSRPCFHPVQNSKPGVPPVDPLDFLYLSLLISLYLLVEGHCRSSCCRDSGIQTVALVSALDEVTPGMSS